MEDQSTTLKDTAIDMTTAIIGVGNIGSRVLTSSSLTQDGMSSAEPSFTAGRVGACQA